MGGTCPVGHSVPLRRVIEKARASLSVASLALFLVGCESPLTIATHDPIYPKADQAVTFTLEKVSGSRLRSVALYEVVSNVDANGTITSTGDEAMLKSWSSPGKVISFTKPAGYPPRTFVRYRFKVKAPSSGWGGCFSSNDTFSHEIVFATRPYPVPGDPAPVYVTGDPNEVFDIVLIPDTDIPEAEMDVFRDHCRRVVREAFLDEPTTRAFRRSFNFYINPHPGTATDYNSAVPHIPPVNFARLSFAEGRVLMHKGDLRDYSLSAERFYSTEMENLGTILHESGHGLFGLADEYGTGRHWKPDPKPNNWDAEGDAMADARGMRKSASDVQEIVTGAWWKLCGVECQMNTSGERHTTYDRPCHERVVWCVLDHVGAHGE